MSAIPNYVEQAWRFSEKELDDVEVVVDLRDCLTDADLARASTASSGGRGAPSRADFLPRSRGWRLQRSDSEETLFLPGRDDGPTPDQQPDEQHPSSQQDTQDQESADEIFGDTDPSSQLDQDIQHINLGGMTVAMQNSPSPMA
eukprot:s3557_g4.t1